MPQFSRITIIETIELLESLTHAELDRFLLKFGLEQVAPQGLGSKTSRLNALIKYLIDNPDEKGPFGANLTFEIIEDVYSPKKFDFKYLQTTNGLRQTNREEGKVHRATQEKRKEQQRDSV